MAKRDLPGPVKPAKAKPKDAYAHGTPSMSQKPNGSAGSGNTKGVHSKSTPPGGKKPC